MANVSTPSGPIAAELRLAICLRYLAGGSYLDIAFLFGVALRSVYRVTWEVIDAINKNFDFPWMIGNVINEAKFLASLPSIVEGVSSLFLPLFVFSLSLSLSLFLL